MIVSIIKKATIVSTDVTDVNFNYDDFHYYVTFAQGMRLVSNNVLYERTGGSIYTHPPSGNAEVGDMAYLSPAINRCYAAVDDTALKQPSEYAAAGDLPWAYTHTEFYAKVQDDVGTRPFNGFRRFGNREYELFRDASSSTGWTFTIASSDVNISKEVSVIDGVTSDDSNIVGEAVILNDGTTYVPYVFIIDPLTNALYYKTPALKAVETEIATSDMYVPVYDLRYFSGWTKKNMSMSARVIDNKNYTYAEFTEDKSWTLTSDEEVDTVAITGVLCDSISVEFKTGDTVVYTIPNYIPSTKRDTRERLSGCPVTEVFYCPSDLPVGSQIKVTFHTTTKGRAGGVKLGLSVDGGFTNLAIQNTFRRNGLKEKDYWGEIITTNGAKKNVFSGTCDIEITDYNTMHNLWTSIGDNTVIINGAVSKDNYTQETSDTYAPTKIVGRVDKYALRTNLKNKRMGDKATYSFEVEGDI